MVHTEDRAFLEQLGVAWYHSFGPDMSNVPADFQKMPYISTEPLLSAAEIAALVQNAPPGSWWYVGGEPNRPPGFVSGRDFVDVFDHYYTQIKGKDPSARIMSPSLLNWWFTCFGCNGYQSGQDWVDDFITAYQAKHGIKPPVDAWNIDLYPIDWRGWQERLANRDPSPFLPNDNWQLMRDQITGGTWSIVGLGNEFTRRFFVSGPTAFQGMRSFLDSRGYQDTPIWITEMAVHWGYDDIVATTPPGPAGNYRWDDLSVFLNNLVGWLEDNSSAYLIDRWFLYRSWRNIAVPTNDAYAGIILFGSNEATEPPQLDVTGLNCLGDVYRARSLGLAHVQCDAAGNTIPAP